MDKVFGLIGYPLSHSFSKRYFSEKFARENIAGCRYELFELPEIGLLPGLIQNTPSLKGLNVTIPYKEQVKKYINSFDDSADKVGAVNVIRIEDNGSLKGYNSDYYGFRESLESWLPHLNFQALILGTGGASKAVAAVLNDLQIPFKMVSRKSASGAIAYEDLSRDDQYIRTHKLIVNTTPLGMSPHIENAPSIPYEHLTESHFLYDLVYNPEETRFMTLGKAKGAKVKNGLEMLRLQADKSWEIWNS